MGWLVIIESKKSTTSVDELTGGDDSNGGRNSGCNSGRNSDRNSDLVMIVVISISAHRVVDTSLPLSTRVALPTSCASCEGGASPHSLALTEEVDEEVEVEVEVEVELEEKEENGEVGDPVADDSNTIFATPGKGKLDKSMGSTCVGCVSAGCFVNKSIVPGGSLQVNEYTIFLIRALGFGPLKSCRQQEKCQK